MSASVTPTGSVSVAAAEAPAGGAASGASSAPRLTLQRPQSVGGSGSWVLAESEFGPGVVGGKSANLAALRSKLPAG